MSRTFSSLSIPNYRIWFFGALISNVGTWMGRIAQDWVVLVELTDGSASALGIVTGLQFLPMLLLAPFAGAISDRFPKRRVLVVTQSIMCLTAVLMGVLVLTGTAELWHMYALAFMQGSGAAVDAPTRQAFVSEVVGQENIANAVSLNSASFNGARLIGPAAAGLLIAWIGTGPTFLVNAASFLSVLLALVLMDGALLHPAPRATGKGRVREGLAYVRHRPDLLVILTLVFCLGTFGMNFGMTNALMATEVFGKGAEEYGLLGSIMAIGSLSAALTAARRPRPRLRHLMVALYGFSLASLVLALAPNYVVFSIALVPAGFCALLAMTTANAMVQLSVDPALRGRVMALYMAIFMGGTPLGSPAIGWIGEHFGARSTVLVATIFVGLPAIALTIYVMRSNDLHLRLEREGRTRLVLERGEVSEAVDPVPERVGP